MVLSSVERGVSSVEAAFVSAKKAFFRLRGEWFVYYEPLWVVFLRRLTEPKATKL